MKINKKLDNQIMLTVEQTPYDELISFGFWFNFGSAYEALDFNGSTHLLEHIIYRQPFVEFIENKGGQVDCVTSKEYVSFNITTNKEYYMDCFNQAIDQIFNPNFTEEIIHSEKEIVLEEINYYKDNLIDNILDNVPKCAFSETNPLTLPILGNIDSLNALNLEMLNYIWSEEILCSPLVVSINGGIIEGDLIKTINIIQKLPKKNKILKNKEFRFKPSFVSIQNPIETETSVLNLVIESEPMDSAKGIMGDVLMNHLTNSGQNALLTKKLRSQGLSYQVFSYYLPYSTTGMFGITAISSIEKLKSLFSQLNETLSIAHLIDSKEYELLIQKIVGQTTILHEKTLDKMKFQAINTLFSKPYVFLEEYIVSLKELPLESYTKFIKDAFSRKRGYYISHNKVITKKYFNKDLVKC